jgi:hypothetical protein
MKVVMQTPQLLLSWLLHCGGVKELTHKEEISVWITTPAGILALEQENNIDKIEALFNEEPRYKSIYLSVMKFCKEARSRMDIEAFLSGNELMENPKIYPSYFIDTLEKADALVWNNHWSTTQNALSKL